MNFPEKSTIGVVGAGAWGTTLALLLAQNGWKVKLWAFEKEVAEEINRDRRNSIYLEDVLLPEGIEASEDLSFMEDVERLIIAVPSAFYSSVAGDLARHVKGGARIISATKGFIGDELKRPSEFLREVFPGYKIGVLSGPNLAREIAAGLHAISLVSSEDEELVREFQMILSSERFRVYGGTDIIGTELGGALKNIYAIAAGIAEGFHLGENALAALITRGLAEMIKLGKFLGAQERTFFGVSGLGDLVCTCQSKLSRNHQVGVKIAEGRRLEEVQAEMKAVAEGIDTTRHVHHFAISHDLDLPITRAVYKVLFEGTNPGQALHELMTRTLKME